MLLSYVSLLPGTARATLSPNQQPEPQTMYDNIEDCYQGKPIVQYMHVASAVCARVRPNVLKGQLRRFIITYKINFVSETRNCMHDLLQ
jgi:hypothetical protein